ncbi:unnamed protein product [Clonostachys rhizophaga]|uniref:Glutamyl/glutaminyl-tRNA synthetase class Ib catalytic domain-containing protein n=1 Tax=Clonostachys rhizophaga TaxID=160324 RepID=A0A9N9YWT4_9HYPO|nr:unnamed protein product [Clonostachys rhizophaga]
MKIAELAAIPASLTGDFRAKESHVLDLDEHLTLRTYHNGYKLSELDEKIWVALASNRAAVPFIRKGNFRLRLDDTNRTKEKEEYQDAIIEDLARMGIHADKLTYTSDYF